MLAGEGIFCVPGLEGACDGHGSVLLFEHFTEADEGEAEEEDAGDAHDQQLRPEFVQSGAAEDDALAVDGVLGARPVFAEGARQFGHVAA